MAFRYPTRPDVPVLQDISFHIAAGEKIALVGPSGAGKSTIARPADAVLPPQRRPHSWSMATTCSDYDLTGLRRHIGIVPQETLLFGGTIRENIAYGKPGATDAEIIEAAQRANAWQFIQAFPEGLDTVVGERGIKLSGGQRQRVAIARAILKNPAILHPRRSHFLARQRKRKAGAGRHGRADAKPHQPSSSPTASAPSGKSIKFWSLTAAASWKQARTRS